MSFKPVVLGLLAAGCVTAAAGGAYLAVRQNAQPGVAATRPVTDSAATAPAAEQLVTETEGVVSPNPEAAPPLAERPDATAGKPAAPAPIPAPAPAVSSPPRRSAARVPAATPPAQTSASRSGREAPPARSAAASRAGDAPAASSIGTSRDSNAPASGAVSEAATPEPAPMPEMPARPAEPKFVEVVIPSSSVIGLQVDRSLSSETARVEDKVEARVTRDVMASGRRAIPAGSRMVGSVVLVDQGGKMKGAARLGVRFHTLVLGDGSQVPLRTETIFRDGQSPGNESSRKIGGAAVGGAILGAILGGGKGAVLGGATGAAGGTAVVMAGGRNAATLPAGTILTAHVSGPVTMQVERE
jgi:type IV secretory pathway VirB10-like protein